MQNKTSVFDKKKVVTRFDKKIARYLWGLTEDPISEDPKENPLNEKAKEDPYYCET